MSRDPCLFPAANGQQIRFIPILQGYFMYCQFVKTTVLYFKQYKKEEKKQLYLACAGSAAHTIHRSAK